SIILLGCPQKAEADQTKEESSPSVEDIVQTEKPVNPGDVVVEKAPVNTDTSNSRDPYWSTLGYETWQGITDVTELPESLMLDMLNVRRMFYQRSRYPTLEEIISTHKPDLGELTAENLNSFGYDLYEAGNFKESMQLFVEAMLLDPTYVYAHYNFACVGSLYLEYWSHQDSGAYAQQEGFYDEAYLAMVQDEVFQNLSISFFLASRYLDKSKTDPDLEYIRSLKRYNNLRQNLSEPKFWILYGYHHADNLERADEIPSLGELSVTLDGGFYSASGIDDIIVRGRSSKNMWEYGIHKLINRDQVSLIKVDFRDLPALGYRINYDYINDPTGELRQPYVIANQENFTIKGLLYFDDHWEINSTTTVYSYDLEYPQKQSDGTLNFPLYEDWKPSNKTQYFNTVKKMYDYYYKKNTSSINEKLNK
ncbi:hypothetical protein, partial [Spirochaeta cellobiosiphila]|uniref:hypothetical protein n=1 Tax=Spirochaeta cellobiosiphila TaxID=504483 RepID=UPI00056A215F